MIGSQKDREEAGPCPPPCIQPPKVLTEGVPPPTRTTLLASGMGYSSFQVKPPPVVIALPVQFLLGK